MMTKPGSRGARLGALIPQLLCCFAALMILSATLAAHFPAPTAQAKTPVSDIRPALWAVSDADTTLILFGSVHVLRPTDKWRFPALNDAMKEAQSVYFEAPTDLFSQTSTALLLVRLGLNPPGTTLSSKLSPAGRARLARIAAQYDVPAESLEPLRPWYAFLTLSTTAAAKLGAAPAHGVDAVLEAEARGAGKDVRTFETLEQQIRIFSDLEDRVETAVLEIALEDLEERPEQFVELVEAWKRGDLAAMERLSLDSLRAGPPEFFHRIYTERNRAWVETLDVVLQEQPGVVLVVVGAAHLLGGEAVQTLLEQRGYFVARR